MTMTTTHETIGMAGRDEAAAMRPLHELLRRRHSPRAYESRPIEAAKLRSLLEAARWSPSANNNQPWRFIVGERGVDDMTFDRLLGALAPSNARWAHHVPVLMLAVAKLYDRPGKEKNSLYDLGLAVAHLTTQATALGLAVHQMGGFDGDKAREEFGIPAGYEPVAMIAIGYQGDPALLPDDLRERELTPRRREELDTFVYGARWGETSALVK